MHKRVCSTHFLLLWFVAVLFIAGCGTVISQAVRKEADRTVGFEGLLGDPDAYRGRTVLLGGEIIEVRNLPGNTLIFVLQRPLGLRDEPAVDKDSGGRFLVIAPGFLDPAIYRPGRKVTVAGVAAGKETHPLGEVHYTYPVIAKKELHLWPSEENVMAEPGVQFGVGIGIMIQGR